MSDLPLAGRRVVLGVAGGIAAYKAAEVCRRLMEAGADVRVAMTPAATRFVAPLTFSALSGKLAATSLWDGPDPIAHTSLGQWAEVVVVAPATARLLGAYTAGISDDLLTATLLATRAPVVVCPAMHTEMWEHPAVQDNLARLRSRGVHVVAPGVGRLAGGDFGPGRLAEPGDIVASVSAVLLTLGQPACAPVSGHQSLAGRQVLVTAGGTREPIDPVRYLGNRSSGRQGYALAAEARARGASVILVSAVPGAGRAGGGGRRGSEGGLLLPPEVEVVPVDTAEQMANAVASHAPGADVVIMAAAVADFRPKAAFDHKLKKADGVPELLFEPTPDILAELGRTRRPAPDQLLVGFAAETAGGDAAVLEANALDKLRRKHLDLVVANDVSAPGVGFGYATNAVLIVAADGDSIAVPLGDKTAIAAAVLDAVVSRLSAPGPPEPRSSP